MKSPGFINSGLFFWKSNHTNEVTILKAHQLSKLLKKNGWYFDRRRHGGNRDVWMNDQHDKVEIPHYRVINDVVAAKKVINKCNLK